MSILVIGSTGTIGSLVVERLAQQGANVSAMVRQVGKATLPSGVKGVVGEREVQGVPRHERELRIPIGPHLQHAQREVTRDHKCPRSGKWDRRCPGTRGEVEDDLAGQRFDRVHDGFAPPPG